jgi:hypothetical protein
VASVKYDENMKPHIHPESFA